MSSKLVKEKAIENCIKGIVREINLLAEYKWQKRFSQANLRIPMLEQYSEDLGRMLKDYTEELKTELSQKLNELEVKKEVANENSAQPNG